MLSVDEIRQALKPMNLMEVSRLTGVSYGSIRRLMEPDSKPAYETVRKVADWLESRP
jgi:predicted transcriptional regulator